MKMSVTEVEVVAGRLHVYSVIGPAGP
jgi:hypothetical protein